MFSNKNPGYQIAFYMQHSGVEWGILTNGRLWRLYQRDTAYKLDRYYEVDLPALLEADGQERFLYFYAFFARAAFDDTPIGVRALLAASQDYARGVGDSLKLQVFEALRHLAQGFLDYRPNRLAAEPETLDAIYDASLIVLYRLLFILYAEARDLLPVASNGQYREGYSLYAIKRSVRQDLHSGRHLLPGSAMLWPRLSTLFQIIDEGSPPLQVGTFNGGLFDPERHPFPARHIVGDHHLQQAIYKLTCVDDQFVDFRDLQVRHLGTIYEGLLEHHLLPIAPEDGWTVALANERGERHVTGSYYTPDFVVGYMVEETLEPLLRRAVDGAANPQAAAERVLGLNVLDPAMGSAHFLVEATEYIARFLVDLNAAPPEAQADGELAYWKRRVAQSCVYGVDLNPLAVELGKLSLWLATVAKDRPLSFLDHHLRPGNALIGARLAELSVAEPTGRVKRPRKRAAPAEQLALFADDEFRQRMSTAVDSMWLIEGNAARTVADVKEQEGLYAELRRRLIGNYGALANLITATHFGLAVDPALLGPLADYARGRSLAAPARFTEWLEAARATAERKRFFQWELEFPEVFFDRQGQPLGEMGGFDAVLGNPPYVRQEALGPDKPYLAAAFPETYHGVADLYVYFYQQGLQLTRPGGRMSYIVTNKWLRSGYGEPLRGYFAAQGALERIIDFGHAPIFEGADVFPCIVQLQRPSLGQAAGAGERSVQVTAFPREALGTTTSLGGYVAAHSHTVPLARLGRAAWSLEQGPVDDLLEKIRRAGLPLAEYAGVKPLYGVKTGLNEAFLIDGATRERLVREDPACAAIIKPYLRGQDIKRWHPDWQGLWMIVVASSENRAWPWSAEADVEVAQGIFARAYPSLHAHLAPLADALRKRQDQGRYWWELRSCAYYDKFATPKLLYQEIQFHSSYSYDTSGMFANNKVFLLPTDSMYLLAVLNSPLMWWHNWRYLPHMKDEALSPVGVLMEKLPIVPPTDELRAEVEPAVERLIALTGVQQQARRVTLDWLRTEFDVASPGTRLEEFALDEDAFVAEVRKRRPTYAGALSPATLRALRAGYAEQAGPLRAALAEVAALERRLAALVNRAYGLTPEEEALLWETGPPRMPRF